MAKQDPKDLFGFSDDNSNGPEDGEEDADVAYVILQIIPADGWRAIYVDDNSQRTILNLACFALVEVPSPQDPQALPVRVVRPMVATNDGQIEDAEVIDDFLILVSPPVSDNPYSANGSLETQIVNAILERARADKARK